MLFNHDWWFGGAFAARIEEARRRCARHHFPGLGAEALEKNRDYQMFLKDVEARTILYLRDGFSYEVKEIISLGTAGSLSFECTPADEAYKVGAFVVTVPFDDIVRVEVFAVHGKEKPEDMPSIKGFSSTQGPGKRMDDRGGRSEASE
jgi:hypothetical protein